MMNGTGKENVKSFNLVDGRFLRQVTLTAITIFICGIIVSSILSTLNFTIGFMVFASTTGFFGGLLLSEALFYRSMEVKA